jgi:hypothetical protein
MVLWFLACCVAAKTILKENPRVFGGAYKEPDFIASYRKGLYDCPFSTTGKIGWTGFPACPEDALRNPGVRRMKPAGSKASKLLYLCF